MNGKLWFKALLTGLMLTTLVMAGCEGDDGDDGAPGASAYEIAVENGFTGTEQEWLDSLAAAGAGVAEPVETCVICHGENAFADAEATHEGAIERESITFTFPAEAVILGEGAITVDFASNTAGLTPRFALAKLVNGEWVNYVYRTVPRGELPAGWNAFPEGSLLEAEQATFVADVTVTETAAGTYTATLPVVLSDTDALHRIAIYANPAAYGTGIYDFVPSGAAEPAYQRELVTDNACNACHGELRIHGERTKVDFCVTCHNPDGGFDPETGNSIEFTNLIHKTHTGHNLESGEFVIVGFRQSVFDAGHITYPTYMTNCSVCHETPEALAEVNSMSVSGPNCLSCHDTMASWDFDAAGVSFHNAYNGTENCQQCHNDTATGIARATVAEFHNGLTTERAGLIWDGRDASVTEGARIDHQITGVTRTGDSLAITWGATVGGLAVDPCNTTATVDAPTFTSGYSVLKAFFQANDLVNANNGNSSPGQANSTNLDFTAGTGNTVCAGNVATTTITLTPAEAVLTGNARVALQGKPQLQFAPANETISVRAKTPTFDFALATGATLVDFRRPIAVSENCLKCHVGSLYQHGGNRVDNVELCVMCHNEASNEQNVREGMGVDPSEAYDGKAGQTYGFKSMLHAIHSSGETGAPIVIYRNRGIFAWAADESALANWPGTGEDLIVFGSDPASPNSIQDHSFHAPTYPRPLNECAACHADGFATLPDQSVSVATTINAGSEPFDNQLDDVLEGTSAAACMSCHQSGVSFEQNALKAHAYQNGWTPQTFEEGRQTIIDAAQ